MHWLIAPDSFKGSLGALAAAQAMAAGVRAADPNATLTLRPMADGGEGTLDAVYAAIGGRWIRHRVSDAAGLPLWAEYLLQPDGSALIEVARVVGLAQCPRLPLWQRSSVGVGQLIRQALNDGASTIALALGGSSTNDAGAGLLAALGARFLAADGSVLAPNPHALQALSRIDTAALPDLGGVRLELWSDVDNPLCGARGAAAVFGAQKGMLAADLAAFDALHARLAEAFGAPDLAAWPGAGAAGGMGWALLALGAQRVSGAAAVAERIGLLPALACADWVLTGEGRSDAQTLSGKAPFAVARLARTAGVPVSLVSGALAPDAEGLLANAFDGCFALCSRPLTLTEALADAPALLAHSCSQLARAVLAARR